MSDFDDVLVQTADEVDPERVVKFSGRGAVHITGPASKTLCGKQLNEREVGGSGTVCVRCARVYAEEGEDQ